MTDAPFLRSVGIDAGGRDPVRERRIKELGERIDGLQEARRILFEAKRVARWRTWAGKSSWHAVHAIELACTRMLRESKQLKDELARLEAIGS